MFSILRKLGWFFKLRWKSYTFGVFGLIAVAILSAVTPLILGNIIDQMVNSTLTFQSLALQSGTILVFAIAMYGLRYGWRVAIFGNSTLLESILRNRLFAHFTKMDSQFFHEYRTGDLMAHATNDLAALRFVAGGGILSITDSIFIGGTTLFSMIFFVDWKLTLFTTLPFPLLIVAARYMGKAINKRYRKSLESFSQMNNRVQESVGGMKVIKTFGEEEAHYADFTGDIENVIARNKAVYQVDSAYSPIIEGITGLTYVLTLFFGSYFISIDRISLGQLIAYFSYLSMMTWPLLAIGRVANTLERGNASYNRVTDLLSKKSSLKEAKNPIQTPVAGDIAFTVDSFTYPDGKNEVLQNAHFQLKSGNTLGIVGHTGSGKSTIFKLLLRDYDGYTGKIKYNDKDIKHYSLDAVSQGIGYVPQGTFLFSTTVRENICFVNPQLTQEQVEHFAKLADIHDDIEQFPEGYDTEVGERGVSLSGGQKQRIAIARALATQAEFLILDDALSAVDAQTEARILENLRDIRRNESTIIATHRISSIMHADEIIVLDKGQIVERGTHTELLANEGWYSQMYEEQQLQQKVDQGGETLG
ncbi:ATP-binding cassette domain-containing protein [Jeotgalibaca porci]|uniref:ATP-binding cassette domain-containing protein n=2 Tax=Jeotgalibaca porci TaxID=1868793 RepID=A0A6G7WIU0_9LACT|nr:ABC transporter transmembrane domain-containing protein [Jeotgalibaca porci]QIK52152.1 ATP-binding cassette domain-containing protein [Jeotgalibaca porci]